MVRTTIGAPPELLDRLREIAAARGMSRAALIREALEEKAREYEPGSDRVDAGSARPKPRSFGIANTGRSNTAEQAGDMVLVPRAWLSKGRSEPMA